MLELKLSKTGSLEIEFGTKKKTLEEWAILLFHIHSDVLENQLYNALAEKNTEEDIKKIVEITAGLIENQTMLNQANADINLLESAKIPIVGNQDVDTALQ